MYTWCYIYLRTILCMENGLASYAHYFLNYCHLIKYPVRIWIIFIICALQRYLCGPLLIVFNKQIDILLSCATFKAPLLLLKPPLLLLKPPLPLLKPHSIYLWKFISVYCIVQLLDDSWFKWFNFLIHYNSITDVHTLHWYMQAT